MSQGCPMPTHCARLLPSIFAMLLHTRLAYMFLSEVCLVLPLLVKTLLGIIHRLLYSTCTMYFMNVIEERSEGEKDHFWKRFSEEVSMCILFSFGQESLKCSAVCPKILYLNFLLFEIVLRD